ncbi:flavodoxin [Levilactobacillus bambusae]|uniref:Flavodoxin n=1 Tax=Levilactobacillus bambusae TaxID=2024736 RepID=A0A2V1MZJ1_9LACO|nr:flavodoxin [Levilactobacillus bambusae]PWF99907.1 flavodoxin [Levilactobacillus bambusae]
MMTAHVVFATITGNNEDVADIVTEQFETLGVKVQESEISQMDAADLLKSDILVVCAYTYDEGSLPEEGMDFYDDLQDLDLTGHVYGVAGSGDTYYGKYYNTTVDRFDEAFKKTGAKKGADDVKINLEPGEKDIQALDDFVSQLVRSEKKQRELN